LRRWHDGGDFAMGICGEIVRQILGWVGEEEQVSL
jgi:hypothetical protein